MQKNILVTGGLGYIGSHVVVELFKRGYNPIIVDKEKNSETLYGIKKIIGFYPKVENFNICVNGSLIQKIRPYRIDGIIHLANYKSVSESQTKPLMYYKNNIESTLEILSFMNNRGIRNLVFSSSASVYSPGEKRKEDSNLVHNNVYASTKIIQEQILNNFENVKNLRYFNPIGLHPSGHLKEDINTSNVIPSLIRSIVKFRPFNLYGNCHRDYVHVMDVAKCTVDALELSTDKMETINIGTGISTSTGKLVTEFMNVNNVHCNINIDKDARPGDVDVLTADVSKAESLEMKCSRTLEEMLVDSWRPYK